MSSKLSASLIKFAQSLKSSALTTAFEFIFVLFMFAGQYKAAERLSWVPVDLTGLFFCITVFMGASFLLRKSFRFQSESILPIGIFSVFVIYCVLSLSWSSGAEYASDKALRISTLVFWAFLVPSLFITQSRIRMQRLFLALVLLSAWFAIESLITLIQSDSEGFIIVLGSNYLGSSRIIGIGSIITLIYAFYTRKSYLIRILSFTLFTFFVFMLLFIGGRAPLLSLAASMLILLPLNCRLSCDLGFRIKRRILYMFFFLFLAIGSVTCFLMVTDSIGESLTTISRFLVLLEPGGGTSASLRIEYFISSIHFWLDSPILGHGIGSWPILMGHGDARGYPHNLFLEVLSELGLIALLITGSFIALNLRRLGSWSIIRNDAVRTTVLMLFVYAIINASISGDIPDNRFLFMVLGCMSLPKSSEE